MLSSEPKAEADNIYQDLDFQEPVAFIRTYAHTPVRTAEIWKICLYFPENIFLALNGDD